MKFKRPKELKRTKIEIIPMIDTVLFMLVFFMLSSLAMVHLNGLQVNLPKAGTSARQATQDLTITVDKFQRVFVNKKSVQMSNLAQTLSDTIGPNVDMQTQSVIINADFSVPNGLVVHCIDASRQVGIRHFVIATAPGESGGNN
jgi:biopolymer transport protein ExbD